MNIRSINNLNLYAQVKTQAETRNNANQESVAKPADKIIKKIDALKERGSQFEGFLQNLEEMRKQSKASAEMFEIQRKCLLIAIRIMSGDNVPPEDIIYLAENAPELYARAMIMRMYKEDPEDHKRVSEDKKSESAEPKSAETPAIESGEAAPAEPE